MYGCAIFEQESYQQIKPLQINSSVASVGIFVASASEQEGRRPRDGVRGSKLGRNISIVGIPGAVGDPERAHESSVGGMKRLSVVLVSACLLT